MQRYQLFIALVNEDYRHENYAFVNACIKLLQTSTTFLLPLQLHLVKKSQSYSLGNHRYS